MFVAHFFCKHGWPPPSELASGTPGVEEGFLRLEPHQFLFGPLTFLFSALQPPALFLISDGQFISDGGNLRPPGFRTTSTRRRCQAQNRMLKVVGSNRLDEVRLRAGAQSLLYVTLIGCG